jgi:hypothetical protein
LGRKTRYRIEFLDGSNTVVRAINAVAGSPADAFLLVVAGSSKAFPLTADTRWPRHALTARVINKDGRCCLTMSKPEERP